MSIRFPDLQVLFPRAEAVARTQQVMQRHPTLGQEQQAAHDQAVRRRQAESVQKSGPDERVRDEEQSDGSRRQPRDDGRESASGDSRAHSDGKESVSGRARASDGKRPAKLGPGGRVDVRV